MMDGGMVWDPLLVVVIGDEGCAVYGVAVCIGVHWVLCVDPMFIQIPGEFSFDMTMAFGIRHCNCSFCSFCGHG